MKISWIGIFDRGVLANERIHFRALYDLDIVNYAVYDTTRIDKTSVFSSQKSCWWFSSKKIKAGENVVLYTRAGIATTETRQDGAIYHFLFRGLIQPLYVKPEACAVMFEINFWDTNP
jgi:hypothetical protein